ncbi:hypothetical protein [Brevundimonas sp.]|uniref:hypothetical protein n=1 Tax=Brevundimonas sp. TaxID=1871086 RepID=UPI002D4857E3|nr:hypothetical protein [Brevundimonas sp.]HYD26960.1 hypothetical protein [Brevundimonas sp.]
MTILARFRVREITPGDTVETTLFRLTADHAEDAPDVTVTVESPVSDLFALDAQVYVHITPSTSDVPD